MQPQTAETPQYAKAGSAYETSTAQPINPRGLYFNPGNGIYIATTHEIQGDALIRQGYQLVHEGPVEAAAYEDEDGNKITPLPYQLSDKQIRQHFTDGKLNATDEDEDDEEEAPKPKAKKATAKKDPVEKKELKSATDEFNTPPEDEDDEEETEA